MNIGVKAPLIFSMIEFLPNKKRAKKKSIEYPLGNIRHLGKKFLFSLLMKDLHYNLSLSYF